MKFFSQIAYIARNEARYLRQFPKLLASGAILIFVPALYCLLYISSVWAPETRTAALPVAVVNLDQGVQYKEHNINVGWEITTRLEDSGHFGFSLLKDEAQARKMVRQGKLAFAVIIPKDFSANAVPGAEEGAGQVVVYTSQGNNFESAAIAKRFAEALGREINDGLNERRWVLVLHNAAGSRRSTDRLHEAVGSLGSSAEGLTHSVEPVLEIDAPVENSGSGFASNVIPGALWLGAALAAFLIHVKVLPRQALFFSSPAQVVGKILFPACLVLLQSLMVLLVVLYVLKMHVLHPWTFALTLTLSSLAFLSIVFALSKAFGGAGKEIAMVLLAVQLSSSGGILPVELSGGLFAQISPLLPMTWVVDCVKVSLFGAYEGAWQRPLLQVALVGLASFVLSCTVGRWRFVKSSLRLRGRSGRR
ncbi:YhgE/Pip domain-containing protein [Rhodoferax lacus]|nr:YhgE/Pip family protein [Rhodoferax lacus]